MKLVTYEGTSTIPTTLWGELGGAQRVYVPGQEAEELAEANEPRIVVEVISHTPLELRDWLNSVSNRLEAECFQRGLDIGKREAYDRAWLVGFGVFGSLLLLENVLT